MAITGVAVLVAVATFALGYVLGSLPLPALVARTAGVDAGAQRTGGPGPSGVWASAGPGWGMLAVAADLARGILPVTLAVATFAWPAAWTAGLGTILGARWPALGRLRGSGDRWVLAGVLVALEPAAGFAAALPALVAAAGARRAGRPWRPLARWTALGTYLLLVALAEPDLVRLAAVLALSAAAVVRGPGTRG